MNQELLQELLDEQHDRGGQYRMINQSSHMELVDINLRHNLTCANCGTNKSVKYRHVINGETKYFCNKCILIAK